MTCCTVHRKSYISISKTRWPSFFSNYDSCLNRNGWSSKEQVRNDTSGTRQQRKAMDISFLFSQEPLVDTNGANLFPGDNSSGATFLDRITCWHRNSCGDQIFSILGITVLVFVSLTLLFSIINTHKSGAHFMLGLIITGFALCLGHLVRERQLARLSLLNSKKCGMRIVFQRVALTGWLFVLFQLPSPRDIRMISAQGMEKRRLGYVLFHCWAERHGCLYILRFVGARKY